MSFVKLCRRIGRTRIYFNRGYAVYFQMPMFFMNTSLIFYNFLVKKLYFIPAQYNRFYIFALIFLCTFVPVCGLIGYLDYKKGLYKHEDLMTKDISPIWKDLFSRLERIEKNTQDKVE